MKCALRFMLCVHSNRWFNPNEIAGFKWPFPGAFKFIYDFSSIHLRFEKTRPLLGYYIGTIYSFSSWFHFKSIGTFSYNHVPSSHKKLSRIWDILSLKCPEFGTISYGSMGHDYSWKLKPIICFLKTCSCVQLYTKNINQVSRLRSKYCPTAGCSDLCLKNDTAGSYQ